MSQGADSDLLIGVMLATCWHPVSSNMKHRCTLLAMAVMSSLGVVVHASAAVTPQASVDKCNQARHVADTTEADFIKDGLINPIEGDVVEITPKWAISPIDRQTQWLADIAAALYVRAAQCDAPPSPDTGRLTRTLLVQLNPRTVVGSVVATTLADGAPVSTFVAWSDWYLDERVRTDR